MLKDICIKCCSSPSIPEELDGLVTKTERKIHKENNYPDCATDIKGPITIRLGSPSSLYTLKNNHKSIFDDETINL